MVDVEGSGVPSATLRHHWRALLQLFCIGQCRDAALVHCPECHMGALALALPVPEVVGKGRWLAYYYHPYCRRRFTMDGYTFYPDGALI